MQRSKDGSRPRFDAKLRAGPYLGLVILVVAPSTAQAADLEVHCRKAWNASPPRAAFTKHQIDRITIHHTGTLTPTTADPLLRIRRIQRYHQGKDRRWPDVAYHYLVAPDGRVFEGRPPWAKGDTNTDYDTTGHLLIVLLGNFEKQPLPRPQEAALIRLLAWASAHHRIPITRVSSHRAFAKTLCPGKALHGRLPVIFAKATSDRVVRVGRKCEPVRIPDPPLK